MRLGNNQKFCCCTVLILIMAILVDFVIRFVKNEKLLITINDYRDNDCSNKNAYFFC